MYELIFNKKNRRFEQKRKQNCERDREGLSGRQKLNRCGEVDYCDIPTVSSKSNPPPDGSPSDAP